MFDQVSNILVDRVKRRLAGGKDLSPIVAFDVEYRERTAKVVIEAGGHESSGLRLFARFFASNLADGPWAATAWHGYLLRAEVEVDPVYDGIEFFVEDSHAGASATHVVHVWRL